MHPPTCKGCPHCNTELAAIMDDRIAGRYDRVADTLEAIQQRTFPHRFTAASRTAPSPTHEDFVSRFQPQPARDPLHDALSYGRTPIGPAPAPAPSLGTVPSPGITIPRKDK
jgi:hypothetical protein